MSTYNKPEFSPIFAVLYQRRLSCRKAHTVLLKVFTIYLVSITVWLLYYKNTVLQGRTELEREATRTLL